MAQKPKEKELGGARKMSTGTKVVIGVFAVIMALSMTLPSLTAIFGGSSSTADDAEEQVDDQADDTADDATEAEEEAEEEEDDSFEGSEAPDNETLQSLVESNADTVRKYRKRLAKDEDDLVALLNLGQTYMSWGYSAISSSSTDEETAYSKGLLNIAIDYFDRYLKLNDSATVHIDRALSQYYAGDTDAAIKALEKVCEDYPDNALAWAQLGYLYEMQYDTESASDAYRTAAELDEDERYGVKSYANQRLISLNAKVDSVGDPGEAGVETSESDGQSELMQTLTGN